MKETQEACQAWLDTLTTKVELNIEERAELMQIVGSPGLGHLIGLMLATRQGFYVQLGNTPLFTAEGAGRASVIQGQIQGIDLLPQTLLDLMLPAQDAGEGARD